MNKIIQKPQKNKLKKDIWGFDIKKPRKKDNPYQIPPRY